MGVAIPVRPPTQTRWVAHTTRDVCARLLPWHERTAVNRTTVKGYLPVPTARTTSATAQPAVLSRIATAPFPFTAIVGQEEMRRALILAVVDPGIGGVLVMGHRGTGKSTAVRALAALLPPIKAIVGCPYGCAPDHPAGACEVCTAPARAAFAARTVPVPVVDLPLGATEDRLVGTLDIEQALGAGVKAFEPGLLARANRGFLYIDEVNLLDDHLVDLLLDVAASGTNVVEREGVSVRHPARFVLVGSGNPEEGDLRPQLLDRFGLSVEVQTMNAVAERVAVVRQRQAYDADPATFNTAQEPAEEKLRRRIRAAQKALPKTELPDDILYRIADLCLRLGVDGHRGELTVARAATALAAYHRRPAVTADDVCEVAIPALRHRLRKDPLEETDSGERVQTTLSEVFGETTAMASARAVL